MPMQDNAALAVLVIDPNPGMRGSLQNMLNQAGISKIEFAVSAGTAVKQLARRAYDIILCEYDLSSGSPTGDGQDGQQLLEDVRHHQLIDLSTIFIMLTSEGVYGKVVSAAELTPTDYILKPFTVDALSGRITRALDKRTAFLPAHKMIGEGDLRQAARACAEGERSLPRYAGDFARLRAELHLRLDELDEAERQYRAIVAARPAGWAQLGLARTLFAQGRVDDAQAVLAALIADNPRLMAAYDLLARCHEANQAPALAQAVLEEAVAISPHMIRRLRTLGEVALEAGDVAVAEKSFKQVVNRAKYSEFRNPEDHVRLVKTLLRKGDTTQASGVIRDMERSLRGAAIVEVCRAYSVALLYEVAGNSGAAATELASAVGAVRTASGLSSSIRMDLARTCLHNGLDAQAAEVVLGLMNDVGSDVSPQQAMSVFAGAGRPDLAEGIGQQLQAHAQTLLGLAAEKAGMGDFKGAVQTTLEALHLSPSNLIVLVAAIKAMLRQLGELGWDHALAETARVKIAALARIDAGNAQLAGIEEAYAQLKRKYGISG